MVSFWQAVEVAAQAQNMLTGRTAIGKQGHYKRVVADLDKHRIHPLLSSSPLSVTTSRESGRIWGKLHRSVLVRALMSQKIAQRESSRARR